MVGGLKWGMVDNWNVERENVERDNYRKVESQKARFVERQNFRQNEKIG